MSNQIFHFSNTGISSGQRFYLKDDVSGIFVRNLNIDSNFPVVASNLVYNTGNQTISGVKTFASRPTVNGTGVLLSGDIPYVQTNSYFYVDATRTDSYIENGNILYPYKTLSGAYNAAKNIAYFHNPTYITLLSPIAENLTIDKGYINLVGNNTNKNDPIRITGSLVFAATGGTATDNNFSIAGLGITATSNNKCILFSGNHPQRLFIQDCWLIAKDNGTCLYSNNTNTTSRLQGDILKLSPEGVNTTAIDIVSGTSSISFAETSSSASVLAYVRNNSTLNISNSQIETTGAKAFQVENAARLTLLNSVLTNTANPSTGIFLKDPSSTAVVVGSAISVPANANSYAINGVDYSYLFYKNLYFSIDATGGSTESKIGNNVNKNLINSYDPVVYSIGDQTISGIKTFAVAPILSGNPLITGVDLSSYLTSSTASSTYATIINLASTGSTLDNKINNLSGVSVLTFGNQNISGIKTFNNGLSTSYISGIFGSTLNIIAGSGVGGSNINASDLILMGGSLSGVAPNILKTGASITIGGAKTTISSPSTADITIRPSIDQNGTAGNIVLEAGVSTTYNGKINMFGDININGTSDAGTALSSKNINIYRRGDFFGSPSQRLAVSIDNNNVNFQNGMGLQVSGVQVTPALYATSANLASTGSTLATNLASTGSTLSTNLNTTGSTLSNKIDSLSGSSVLLYGNQSIGGVKTFRDNVYINNLYVTGTETIVNTSQVNLASNYLLLNITGGAVDGGIFFVTGSGLTGVNDTGPIIGFDHSNKFKFGISTRNSDLSPLPDIASVQQLVAYSGVADAKFGTITNLASTGSTLNTKIDNLSGYINSTSSNIVFTTGNQTIAGNKNFTDNINLTGINNRIGKNHYLSTDESFVFLKDGGGNDILSTEEYTLTDGSQVQSVLWNNRQLLDANSQSMLYWYDTNVGIGTTSPSEKLHVNGDLKLDGSKIYMYDSANGANNALQWGDNELYFNNNYDGDFRNVGFWFNAGPLGENTLNSVQSQDPIGTRLYIPSGKTDYIALNSEVVHKTGNETISGTKNFINDTTFGDSAQGDFLVISGNNFTVYGSGNFTSGLFVNRNPVLTGSSTLYATTVNLASTGSTLDTKINNLSGYINSPNSNIVFTTGNQTISGLKTFNTGLSTKYISGVSGSSLDIIGFSGEVVSQLNRAINIQAGHGGTTIPVGGGAININAGNSAFFSANTSNINLTAGTGTNNSAGGINIYAGASPNYAGTNTVFGNIDINNSYSINKTINIYRSGNIGAFPYAFVGVVIDNNKVDVNNGMVLQVSGVNVTPSLYVNTTSNQTINGLKTFTSGIDIYSGTSPQSLRIFNSTGTNSGEFALIGWQPNLGIVSTGSNALLIGAQTSNSGVLRDVIITGENIALSPRSGRLYINGTSSLNDHLLQTSQCSGNITGYITGLGFTGNYTGNYEGGYFLGRTKLSQNTVQLVESSFGNNYVRKSTTAPNQIFRSAAVSSDGRYQITAVGDYGPSNGYVYVSNDHGNTWTPRITDATRLWRGVAISADGKYQTACHHNGYIYISNDYGNTWTAKDSVRYWTAVAMSSDGKYQTATGGAYGTQSLQIYISSDYGNTWIPKGTTTIYTSVAMSSDGKYQYATENFGGNGNIYKSSDYGNTWVTIQSGSYNSYTSIATSADGKYVIYCRNSSATNVYISNDYGNTFIAKSTAATYFSVAISDNGKYMVAGIGGYFVSTGGIYFSSDYGNTWKLITPSSGVWTVAMSSNAKYVIGVSSNTSTPIHIFKTDELIDGNLTINNNLTLPSGDFYSYNATGVNSGEFGLIGWRNNQFVIGSQRTTSGILRDVTLTGNNININPSGAVIISNPNPPNNSSFILKEQNGNNSVFFNPTQNGGAGALFSNYLYSSNVGSRDNDDFTITYGGGGTKSFILQGYNGSSYNKNLILDSNGNFGIGSGISSAPSRFYVSGNSILQGNVTVSGNTTITGHLSAASKSFLIDHPTQVGKKLQYGSLESPYHGIRLTDKNKIRAEVVKVYLPEYISSLVNEDKVNIQLTNINHDKALFVKEVDVNENNFTVGMNRGWFDKNEYEFYWSFTAERKDIPKLTVEF